LKKLFLFLYKNTMRSRKRYYYRMTQKRDKSKRLLKLIIFMFFLVFLYSLPKISSVKENLLSYFTIKEIKILENNTTIPDEVIVESLIKNKISFLNFKKFTTSLSQIYPEIEKIKIVALPMKKFKVKIISEIPIFYVSNKGVFLSNKNKEFSVYDINKINFDRILQIEYENYYDIRKLKILYQFFTETGLTKEIQKIYVKDNGEYILYTDKQNKIILDEKFDSIERNLLRNIINISIDKNVDVYARIVDNRIVYIK